jgi:hypothetical protein
VAIVLRFTVPAIAAAFLLSGCGGNGGTTAPPKAATAATGTPTASAAVSSSPSSPASAASFLTAAIRSRAAPPRGWKLVVDGANGYQFALPPDYTRVSDFLPDTGKTGKTRPDGMFSLGGLYQEIAEGTANSGITRQMVDKRAGIMAMKLATAAGIDVVTASPDGLTADRLPSAEPALTAEAAKIGAQNLVFRQVTLDGTPALRASYTVKVADCQRSTVTYITVHGDHVYILTFEDTGPPSSKIENQTTASWRFL